MKYPAIIKKEKKGKYIHIEGLLEDGGKLPTPSEAIELF